MQKNKNMNTSEQDLRKHKTWQDQKFIIDPPPKTNSLTVTLIEKNKPI